jgi:hypothetical protein
MILSRTNLLRLTAILAVVAGAVIASPVRGDIADAVGGTLSLHGAQVVPTNPSNPANALVAAEIPTLSESQRSTAERLVAESADVARLLHGAGYEVAHVGPWTTKGGQTRLIGAALFVNLAQPTEISGPWPTADYETAEQTFPPYTEKSEEFTAKGVRKMLIEVDLAKGSVAGVTPADYTSIVR